MKRTRRRIPAWSLQGAGNTVRCATRREVEMKRTAFLGTTAGALGALAATGPAAAETPFVVGSLSSAMDAAIYYPLQQGWFKAAGLDVTVQPISAGPAAMAGVVGGSMQTADGNVLSLAEAYSKGIPVVLIAPGASWTSCVPDFGRARRRTGGAIAQGSRRRHRRGPEPSRPAHRLDQRLPRQKRGRPYLRALHRDAAGEHAGGTASAARHARSPSTIRSAARRSRRADT